MFNNPTRIKGNCERGELNLYGYSLQFMSRCLFEAVATDRT